MSNDLRMRLRGELRARVESVRGDVVPEDLAAAVIAELSLHAEAADPAHWFWDEMRAALSVAAAIRQSDAITIAPDLPINAADIPFAVACPNCKAITVVEAFAAFSGREWGRWVMDENGGRPYFLDPSTFSNRCPVVAADCLGCGSQIRMALAVFPVAVVAGTRGRTVGTAGGVGMRPAGEAPERAVVPVRQHPNAPNAPNMFRGRGTHSLDGRVADVDDAPRDEGTDGAT